MKNNYFFKVILLLGIYLTITELANASWLKSDRSNSLPQEINSQPQKSDSLPAGVTRDWLNSLRDENGNKIIEDEGDAMQRKIFNGMNAGERFGRSVSSAGDVNGDGYTDIIVGAYIYASYTGRAYIYFGGTVINTVADIVLTGEAINNDFGYSVSSAGDVNGDGYSDVIVGALGYSSSKGRAYIYFGGPTMNNAADVIFTGEGILNNFGISLTSAGDVNGDGYSDIIIGASAYNGNTGRSYLFYGGETMDNTADVIFNPETASYFGASVSSAGDVNGDGYSDVIIGAYGYTSSTGRVYLYFGGTSMNNSADVIMTGEAANNRFGISVNSAGDVNGDGYSDVIVGAEGYSSYIGKAYLFLGGTSMDNTADVDFTGEALSNFFGCSVTVAGDVNGDGYSDVIIGAYGYVSSKGRAYLYFGGASMNNTADVILTGEISGDYFGASVSSAEDVNGDGYSDVIIGSPGYSSSTGRAYIFDYFMRNEIVSDLSMTGGATFNNFGISVASAGDVNGDGYSDVIIGSPGYSSSTGRAYIFFGGASMDNISDVVMTGESSSNFFGNSTASAGDVNGDGYSDVIIGAYGYSSSTGRAYIYFGGTSIDNTADVIITGEATLNYFGLSVSDASDVNGDGYSDVIAGAYGYTSNTGRAYVYFGGATMDNIADVNMTGEATGNRFGASVSSAGDVNADGYSDVIAGAYVYNSYTGRVYLYYGGSSVNNTADVVMTGEATNIYFGYSISNAGDVNRDGFQDVIIGALGYANFTGKACIYFGGTPMNNTEDIIFTGEAVGDRLGYSVSDAGDVNGDGYSDVIAGAHLFNSGTGRSYLYFGGTSVNNEADVIMTGESANNFFGASVSSAGDPNGDGYSDLIVGAYGYYTQTGKAHLYFGSAISAKPILLYVRDIPFDQGGKVNIKWARSSFDSYGNSTISNYSVFRSYPPSGGNFSWEEIATITPSQHSFYTYTASTPFDSLSGNNGNLFYKIRARTSNPGTYWESAILSGRSIDNISPPMVSPFTASQSGADVRLNWGRNSALDLKNYILYRSASPTIDPNTEPVYAETTDSTFLDTSPMSGIYYYYIVAQDIHNNLSPVAVAESPNITVNATMFIEGFYNAGANSQVSDTITAYLRNNLYPYSIADQSMAVVSSNGSVTLKFGNASSGTYYLVLTHRNSIETWTASGISVTRGGSVNYDFSNSSSQAFGNNMKQVDTSPVRFAVYSGDVNQDGVVEATDAGAIDNDASNFVSGYVNTDITGDDLVDATDAAIGDNNAANFVAKVVP
ncbi:MAG: hypothetical protein HGGPFJEG_02282 [Ignavibacteria bacterium]|nr:hypothetical protein [Ignavibacteria bacterium]